MKTALLALLAAVVVFKTASPAGLLVHYTFDGNTGNTATDSAAAGGTTNATITGGSFVTDPQRGGVLSMTGTGNETAFGSVAISSTSGSYTFAGWYKGTDTSGYWYDQGVSNRLIPSLGSSSNQDPDDGGAGSGLGAYDGTAWKNSSASNTTWTTGQWVHLAWVFENDGLGPGMDSVTIYLNGSAQDVDPGSTGLQTKRAIANIPNLGGTQRLFARYTGSNDVTQLIGMIDDYRIYDHALSAAEIAVLAAPIDTTQPVLVSVRPRGASSVSPATSLVATFSKNIAIKPGGTITFVDTSDGTGTFTIHLPSPAQAVVSGNNLILNPLADLEPNTNYGVVIGANSIEDTATVPNPFAGTTPGQWTFSTGFAGDPILIQADGAWSWFSDHTARFVNGDLYVGYVKGQANSMAMTRYDFETATAREFRFSTATNPSKDDHDVPNVTVLPDGKILSVYSRHNLDSVFFHRTSLNGNPTSLSDWGPEVTRSLGTPKNTYSNTFRLSAESDKIYNFSRNINFNPTIHISTNLGQTWDTPVHFIKIGTGSVRPYPRYATNHFDRIDLIYTDGHPRNENNSIYHLFYQGGSFRKSDGSNIKSFSNLPLEHSSGERGTVVYPYTTAAWGAGEGPDEWIPFGRAWTWDIQYQPDGKPVCVFQVQDDGVAGPATDFKNDRIYYYYARWDGSQWRRKFIANAGRGLYSSEDDYGGGMCIDPENPNVIYLSSNAANPFDLSTLSPALNPNNEIYEIYRGVTSDGGNTWAWEAITSSSDASNMRPFVPEDHGRSEAVIWFRGRYTTYLNYDCDIYGIFSPAPPPGLQMRNVQWNPGGAAFKWASTPGKSYRIRASLDLQGFPINVASGISAQGDSTYQTFTFPPPVSASPKAFFRVEEE
ncbi:MAG: BNR-4 repeat-containing protein [Verrucomicrobiales bacterium]